MKKYQVIFSLEAQEEAVSAAEYIAKSAPMNAARWYKDSKKPSTA